MSLINRECSVCKTVKPLENFHKDKNQQLGVRSACKECESQRRKEKRGIKAMEKQSENIMKRSREFENVDEEEAKKAVKAIDGNGVLVGGPVYQTSGEMNPDDYPEIERNYPPFIFKEKYEKGKHYSTFICASRNSGKTYLLKHLWPFYKSLYDLQIFFCNSLNAKIYSEFLTDDDLKTCFSEYDSGIINDLFSFQMLTKNSLDINIIFDDCSDRYAQKESNSLLQVFIRGRNSNMSVIFSTQSPNLLSRISRNNVDYLFLMKIRSSEMRLTVNEYFLKGYVPLPPTVKTNNEEVKYIDKWMSVNAFNRNITVIDYLDTNKIYRYRAPSWLDFK